MTNKVTQISDQISEPPAVSGSGGGNGRDSRLERLERQMDEVNKELNTIGKDVASIKEKLEHMPTKHEITNWIWKTTLTVIPIIVGIIIAAIALLTYLQP